MTRNPATSLAAVAIRLLRDVPQISVRDAAVAVGLNEYTVYKYWRLANPGTRPRGRRFSQRTREGWIESFAELCDSMHDCLVDGMTAGEWLAATRRSHGTIAPRSATAAAEERRFYRGVGRLIATRRAARDGEKPGGTYRRIG